MTELKRFRARVIAETNLNLAVTGVGVVVQGVTLAAGDKVLLNGQTTQSENGYRTLSATSPFWPRDAAFDEAAEMLKGTEFFVAEGNTDNAGSTWTLDTLGPITVDTTALRFKRESYGPGAAIHDDDTLTRDPLTNQWTLKDQFTPEGYFSRVQTDSFGRVQDAVTSDLATTFIEGLKIVYDGPAALTVEAGAAHIPGESGVVELEETSLSGLALTANTWYSVFLYESGGTGAIEVVSQGPESIPYLGEARIKGPDGSPDASRRYLGAIYASAANTIRRFQVLPGGLVRWVVDADTLLRAFDVNTSVNTVAEVSIATLVPPTAEAALVMGNVFNNTNNSTLHISSADDGLMTVGAINPTASQLPIGPNAAAAGTRVQSIGPVALGPTKALRHGQSVGPGAGSASQVGEVHGYWEGR